MGYSFNFKIYFIFFCPPFEKEGWYEVPEDLSRGHEIPHPQNADTL